MPTNQTPIQSKIEVFDLSKVPGIPKDFDTNVDGSLTILSFDKEGFLTTFDNAITKSISIEAPLSFASYYRLLVDGEGNSFIYQNEDSKFTDFVKYDTNKRFILYQRSLGWYVASNKQKYPNTIISEQKYFTVFQFASKSKKGFYGGKFNPGNLDDLSGFVEITSGGQKLVTDYTKISKIGNEGLGYPRFVREDANANIWAIYSVNYGYIGAHYLVKYGQVSVKNKIIKLNENGDDIPIIFPLNNDDALVFSNNNSRTSLLYVNSASEIKKVKDLGDINDPFLDKEGWLWYFDRSTLQINGVNKEADTKSISLSEYLPHFDDSQRLYYMNYVFRYDEDRGLFYVMFGSNNTSFKPTLCKVKK